MLKRTLIPVIAALVLAGCGKKETEAVQKVEAAPVRVTAMRVQAQPFNASVAITGTLVSTSRVEVKAETTGKVLKFTKEEGDAVNAGEPVVWVDDSNEKIALRQVETAIQVSSAALERAKVMAAHSRSEYERAKNLLKSGGITDKDYKAAELADLDARAQVALGSAQLDQATAQLAQAKKMLDDSVVTAPVAGVIDHKFVRDGAYVEPPTPVFSLVDNSRLELESMVATSEMAPIRAGQAVHFTVNAWPGQKFSGRVIEIGPSVQAETRSAKIRIRVDNPQRQLKAGMFAQGDILTGVQSQAILVPSAAAYRADRSDNRAYVFVVENGKAVRRNVRLGHERDHTIEVAEGLQAGELLVTEQSVQVAEGVRVEPVENVAAADGAGK